jgi:hypothetical protein
MNIFHKYVREILAIFDKSVMDKHLSRIQEENERRKKMEESKYPIKDIRDRAAAAESWICPDCGSYLIGCDGSLMYPAAANSPGLRCSRKECSYICLK